MAKSPYQQDVSTIEAQMQKDRGLGTHTFSSSDPAISAGYAAAMAGDPGWGQAIRQAQQAQAQGQLHDPAYLAQQVKNDNPYATLQNKNPNNAYEGIYKYDGQKVTASQYEQDVLQGQDRNLSPQQAQALLAQRNPYPIQQGVPQQGQTTAPSQAPPPGTAAPQQRAAFNPNNLSQQLLGNQQAAAPVQGAGGGYGVGPTPQMATVGAYAAGGRASRPTMLVGEGRAPEYVIPMDPQHRARAMELWKQAGQELGVKMADGGYSGSVGGSQSYGASASASKQGTSIVPGMMQVYNQLLGMNTGKYNQIIGAYNQGQQNVAQGTQQNQQAIGQTTQNTLNTLGLGGALGGSNWGVAQPAATAIGQAYAAQQGNTTQQMINSGLGNTSAVGNAQNQNTLGYGQAIGGLGAQLAQTAAGYQMQGGLAGAATGMQGLGLSSGMTNAFMGDLGGMNFSNTAGSLTGSYGSSQSASYNVGNSANMSGSVNMPGGGGGGGGGGYTPDNSGTPPTNLSGGYGGGGY